jgi:hypothetical protein
LARQIKRRKCHGQKSGRKKGSQEGTAENLEGKEGGKENQEGRAQTAVSAGAQYCRCMSFAKQERRFSGLLLAAIMFR